MVAMVARGPGLPGGIGADARYVPRDADGRGGVGRPSSGNVPHNGLRPATRLLVRETAQRFLHGTRRCRLVKATAKDRRVAPTLERRLRRLDQEHDREGQDCCTHANQPDSGTTHTEVTADSDEE